MSLAVNIHDPCWDAPRHGMHGRRVTHRVVLVRHGESTQNREFMASGAGEAPTEGRELTTTGAFQARDVAKYLDGCPFDAVEVSPISRAMETAERFAVGPGTTVRVRYDLRERWFKPTEEVRKSEAGREWVSDDVELEAPDTWTRPQETVAEFRARVAALKERWRRAGTPDCRRQTLVFAHSLLIGQLLGDIETGPFFHLANGSITVVDFVDDGGMHVHTVNQTEHLYCPTGHHTPFSLSSYSA